MLLSPVARNTDPSTSKVAAAKAPRVAQSMRLLAMYAAAGEPLSDEQAASLAGLLGTGYWKRCSDLRNAGYIYPTGDTIMGSAGTPVRLCFITHAGRRELAG